MQFQVFPDNFSLLSILKQFAALRTVVVPKDVPREQIDALKVSLSNDGVPPELAARVAGFENLFCGLDLVDVSEQVGRPIDDVARVYFGLGEKLEFLWMREHIAALPRENRWQSLARAALRDDLYAQQSAVTADVLSSGECDQDNWDPGAAIEHWIASRQVVVGRCRQVIDDLRAHGSPDFTMLSVAMREVRAMQSPST